jgi:hypothetical protein
MSADRNCDIIDTMICTIRIVSLGAPALLLLMTLACGAGAQQERRDPLAAELERSSAFLQKRPETDEIRKTNQPVLARAEEDLRNGRRNLAMLRLMNVRENLALATYLGERPAEQRQDLAGFEAEWTRMGGELRNDLDAPSPTDFADVPAAARALGEAAAAQTRGYYAASHDYGRTTRPENGLYYLATAQAQRERAAFSRTLSEPALPKAPPLRSIRPEIDALEAEMLAVYRPPVSIDRHGEFIVASSALKEARELDAAGLRYGALLRYLETAQISAPLRSAAPSAPGAEAVAGQLRDLETRLSADDVDHSLGRLFLETAQAEPAKAGTIANDILPRYFAALEPARPQPAAPEPEVTVTLVRWPYT